jgi:hypothetical protein
MTDSTQPNEMLDNAMPWWQSRAIIGSLVTVAASAAALGGIAIDVGAVTELALGLISLIGGAMSWWGRVKATRTISRTQMLPGVTLAPGEGK